MGSRKVDTANIDEDLLIASIGKRKQDGAVQPSSPTVAQAATSNNGSEVDPTGEDTAPKEKTGREAGRKKRTDEDSWDTVFRRREIKTRQCVYISREVHNKILKIVNNIADGEISVGAFTDNILSLYLEQNKERINELYRKQRDDLI